jgi:hypothetical protein
MKVDPISNNHFTTLIIGGILGFLTLFISASTPMTPVNQIHGGYTSTMIAFEMAEEPDDIYGIIGGPEDEEYLDYVDQFKSLILYDLIFIILYVVFYLQIISFLHRDRPSAWSYYLASLLIALSGVSDLCENFQMQAILDASSSEKMLEPLKYLKIFTQFKWGIIFAINGWLGIRIWLDENGFLHKGISICLFTSFLFYLSSFLKENTIELGILFLALGFSMFWIYSLLIIVLSRKT